MNFYGFGELVGKSGSVTNDISKIPVPVPVQYYWKKGLIFLLQVFSCTCLQYLSTEYLNLNSTKKCVVIGENQCNI